MTVHAGILNAYITLVYPKGKHNIFYHSSTTRTFIPNSSYASKNH